MIGESGWSYSHLWWFCFETESSLGKTSEPVAVRLFLFMAKGFTAENITFENSAGPVGQAVAVKGLPSDKVKFINNKFLGFQGHFIHLGLWASCQTVLQNCYIEGTVDFIFGSSTAVFDECHFWKKRPRYYLHSSQYPRYFAGRLCFSKLQNRWWYTSLNLFTWSKSHGTLYTLKLV